MLKVTCLAMLMVFSAVGAFCQCSGQNTPPSNASLNSPAVPSGWQQGTAVTVYINTTGYSSGQISAIEAGFSDWQSSSAGDEVTYSFIQVTGQPVPTGHWV